MRNSLFVYGVEDYEGGMGLRINWVLISSNYTLGEWYKTIRGRDKNKALKDTFTLTGRLVGKIGIRGIRIENW